MTIALSCMSIFFLGSAIGVISNALGLGGGFIMLPALIAFVPGMGTEHYNTAKGTDLMCILFIATINAWRMNRGQQDKNLKLVAVMASGSVLGAFVSTKISHHLDADKLVWFFISVMSVLAARTILAKPKHVEEGEVHKNNLLAFMIGLAAGVLSGFTALGGGAVMVPLALLAGLVANNRVVALSNTVMVATTLAASIANLTAERTFEALPYTVGQVNLMIVPLVVFGAQCGAPLGRWLNLRLTLNRRKLIMGVLILIIATGMAFKALNAEKTEPSETPPVETQQSIKAPATSP